jgi:hypothetical protein
MGKEFDVKKSDKKGERAKRSPSVNSPWLPTLYWRALLKRKKPNPATPTPRRITVEGSGTAG